MGHQGVFYITAALFSTSVVVLPVCAATFVQVIYYSIAQKTNNWKFIMLLLIMLWYTAFELRYAREQSYLEKMKPTIKARAWQEASYKANTLSPLCALLFSWKYFDSVTHFVKSQINIAVILINVWCVVLITSITVVYFIMIYLYSHSSYYLEVEYNWKKAQAWFQHYDTTLNTCDAISFIINLSSVALMLLTVWQLKRLIKQLN